MNHIDYQIMVGNLDLLKSKKTNSTLRVTKLFTNYIVLLLA